MESFFYDFSFDFLRYGCHWFTLTLDVFLFFVLSETTFEEFNSFNFMDHRPARTFRQVMIIFLIGSDFLFLSEM